MGFWLWVGLIAVLVLSVPVVSILEKMKNRQPVSEAPAFSEAAEAEENSDATEQPVAEDGNFGFEGGGEDFAGFGESK